MKKGDVVWAAGKAWTLTNESECSCCREWQSYDESEYNFDTLEFCKDFTWLVKDGKLQKHFV